MLLLLIALAQSGYASLSVVFPLGWSLVSLGFALGALFGVYPAVKAAKMRPVEALRRD